MRNKDNDKNEVQFRVFHMGNKSLSHFMEGEKDTLRNLNLCILNHH